MPHKSFPPSEAADSPTGMQAAQPRVTLISGAPYARSNLRAWVHELCPDCETDVFHSVYEATVWVVNMPVDILVLDLDVDPANAPEFVRHVARVSPRTRVFVCATERRPPSGRAFDILSWGECEAALRRWFLRRPSHA